MTNKERAEQLLDTYDLVTFDDKTYYELRDLITQALDDAVEDDRFHSDMVRRAVAAERERCAKLVEQQESPFYNLDELAQTIRDLK